MHETFTCPCGLQHTVSKVDGMVFMDCSACGRKLTNESGEWKERRPVNTECAHVVVSGRIVGMMPLHVAQQQPEYLAVENPRTRMAEVPVSAEECNKIIDEGTRQAIARAEAAEAECAAWREAWNGLAGPQATMRGWRDSWNRIMALAAQASAGSALLGRLRQAEAERDDHKSGVAEANRRWLEVAAERDRLKAEVERLNHELHGPAGTVTVLRHLCEGPHSNAEWFEKHFRDEQALTRAAQKRADELKAENERLRAELRDAQNWSPPELPWTGKPSFCPAHGRRLPCGECEAFTNWNAGRAFFAAKSAPVNPKVCGAHGNDLPCRLCGQTQSPWPAVALGLFVGGAVGVAGLLADQWPAVLRWLDGWLK